MQAYIYKPLQIDALHSLVTANSDIVECEIGREVLERLKITIVFILLFEFDTYY